MQGRLLTVGYPELPGIGFTSVHYRYDGRDNVLSIHDDAGAPFAEYSYNPAGKAITVGYSGGLVAGTQEHDSLGRDTTLTLRGPDGSLTSVLGYNADGLLSSRVETLTPSMTGFDGSEVFGYDTLGRLESATDSTGARSITLSFKTPSGVIDQNGNLQSISRQAGAPLTLHYVPGANRVTSQQDDGKSSVCKYFANGALRRRGSDLTLSYVPGGLLPASITAAGAELTFACDSDGERVVKRVNGGPMTVDVHAHFHGPIVIASDGDAQALVYGPHGVVALASGGERYSVWSDPLGSPRVAWDSSGRAVAAYAYDAYGAMTAANEPKAGFMPIGFTGHQRDLETGLCNFRTRLYDPMTGRFLAPDPASQYPSAYCYAGNVPTMMTDPDGQMDAGLEAFLDLGLLLVAVVASVATAGATSAVVAPLLEVGTALATAQAMGLGAVIGGVGMAVSSAGFQGLYYGLTTAPGDWRWGQFGKDVAAGAIGGAAGGVVTFGLNPLADALGNFLTPLAAADEDIPMDVFAGGEDAGEADAGQPNPAQTRAQRAQRIAARAVTRAASGDAGGALRGYIHKGMTNVFDGRDFNANVGESVAVSSIFGAGFGMLGGAYSAANELEMINTASLKSAFKTAPTMFLGLGALSGVSLLVIFWRRTASIAPSNSGGTR